MGEMLGESPQLRGSQMSLRSGLGRAPFQAFICAHSIRRGAGRRRLGNSIGCRGIHRGIGYPKPRGPARRLRRGLPATYDVSSARRSLSGGRGTSAHFKLSVMSVTGTQPPRVTAGAAGAAGGVSGEWPSGGEDGTREGLGVGTAVCVHLVAPRSPRGTSYSPHPSHPRTPHQAMRSPVQSGLTPPLGAEDAAPTARSEAGQPDRAWASSPGTAACEPRSTEAREEAGFQASPRPTAVTLPDTATPRPPAVLIKVTPPVHLLPRMGWAGGPQHLSSLRPVQGAQGGEAVGSGC